MKQNSDPSLSEELASLPDWDRAFWLSRAFIEASRCLCKSMFEGDFSSQYSSSRVIFHLARQGIELFLKGAISGISKQGSAPATHDLNSLFLEYRRLYPELHYSFDIPARFNVSTNFNLFPDDQKAFHATLDQRHRYPADRKGNTFATREEFVPTTTLKEIEELERQLKVIEWTRIRPYLRADSQIE